MPKKFMILAVAILAAFYLLNPSAGVFELIPDNIPGLGNLDEATAVFLLLACLRYFGIDVVDIFKRTGDD